MSSRDGGGVSQKGVRGSVSEGHGSGRPRVGWETTEDGMVGLLGPYFLTESLPETHPSKANSQFFT